jgi:hypothetical protein
MVNLGFVWLNKGWCSDCKTYTAMTQHTHCTELPFVLNVFVNNINTITSSLSLGLLNGTVIQGYFVFIQAMSCLMCVRLLFLLMSTVLLLCV